MSRRTFAAFGVAAVIGIAVGGAVGLAANGGKPKATITPPPSAAAKLPPLRPVVPQTMLAWTPGQLPPGLARHVAGLPTVAHAVPVVSGTGWLTRSYSAAGAVMSHPPRGFAIPLEVAGAILPAYAPFLSPQDRSFLPELAAGEGILGSTSAKIRHLGAGGVLRFAAQRIRIAGVVPDTAIGANEVFVSRATAAKLRVRRERYLLIDPKRGASIEGIAARIRALLPRGVPMMIRGPNQTTYLRQGDAVLPQVILKELFGEFAARPAGGGFLQIDPAWESAHIVTARVPILGRVTCNRGIVPQLRGALGAIQQEGLSQLIDLSQYGGCFVPKFLLHDPTAGISHHTWGIAIDINVGTNVFGHTPHQDARIVAEFARWGFIWGGRFLVPDGMHFEFIRFASGG